MSNRRIISLIVLALVIGVLFFLYNQQAKKDEEERSMIYGYGAQTLVDEGGYTAARNYADSIFTEMYCNKQNIVYQYAFTENKIDIPHRRLEASLFRGTPNENHLYFYYAIPNIKFDIIDGKEDKSSWNYTGSYTYALIDMRNVARNAPSVFQCDQFVMITKDVNNVVYACLDSNAEVIPADDIQRKMIDYGVLYNSNEDIGTYLANLEKKRIGGYLLAKQKENAADYSLTTSGNSVQSTPANLTDHTTTIGGQTGTRPTPTPIIARPEQERPEDEISEPMIEEPEETEPTPTIVPRIKPERERPKTQVVPKEEDNEGEEDTQE